MSAAIHSLVKKSSSARLTRLLGASVLAAGCLTAACGRQTASLSDLQHDNDKPTRGTQAWMWKEATDAQFERTLAELLGLRNAEFLPRDHELTQRVQMWVDRLDAQLRAAHPADLVNVPRPRAKVLVQSSVNAFVAPVPVCYKVPARLRPGTPTPRNTADRVYLDISTGELALWPEEISCVDGDDDVAVLRSLVERFNAGAAACRYSLSDFGTDTTLVPNADCARGDDLASFVAADGVAFMQTASFITVHTGLIRQMTEAAVVGVIAHELGHYYRSHTSAPTSEYNFFYTLARNQPGHRPVPEADKQADGENALMSSTLINASNAYRRQAGAALRPELFFAAGSVVTEVCAAGSCPDACAEAAELIDSAAFAGAIGRYPYGVAAAREAQAYANFETNTLACFAELDVATRPGTLTADAVSWDRVKELVTAPTWPDWLAQLPPSSRQQLARGAALASLRLGDDAPSLANVRTALVAASTALKDQDDSSVSFLKQAAREGLGYYTIEQEADDEAAEWVAETGIDPMQVVEAMRALGRGASTRMNGLILGDADCNALRDNDWLDANGAYVFVPIGDYAEIHHSICYRMFNLEREIAAHNHARVDRPAPLLGADDWRDLQEQAEGLTEGLGPVVGPASEGPLSSDASNPAVHPLARKANVLSCPYAYSYH